VSPPPALEAAHAVCAQCCVGARVADGRGARRAGHKQDVIQKIFDGKTVGTLFTRATTDNAAPFVRGQEARRASRTLAKLPAATRKSILETIAKNIKVTQRPRASVASSSARCREQEKHAVHDNDRDPVQVHMKRVLFLFSSNALDVSKASLSLSLPPPSLSR